MPFYLWVLLGSDSNCEASEVMLQLDQPTGSATEAQDYLDFYSWKCFLYFALHSRYKICIPVISNKSRAAPGTCTFQLNDVVFKTTQEAGKGKGVREAKLDQPLLVYFLIPKQK